MRKAVVMVAVIVVVIGAFIRLFYPHLHFSRTVTVGVGIDLIGVILLIYGLIAKRPKEKGKT